MATVLVVDDEPDLRELVRLNLELEGHAVITADDGPGALAAMAAADPKPDLAVLDVMMPGLDGWQVLAALKADPDPAVAGVPVLMLTARADDMDRIRGGIEGAVRYLTKPFSVVLLRQAVGEALAGAPEADQRRAARTEALRHLARIERGDAGDEPTAASAGPSINLTRLERPDPERVAVAVAAPPTVATDDGLGVAGLSEKQRELLDAIGSTTTVREAAERLGVSRSNVYASLRRIGRRLGVDAVPELITRARAGAL